MTEGVDESQLPHPSVRGLHCRYKVNSTDAMIEQPGFDPGLQLHYAGDILVGDAKEE